MKKKLFISYLILMLLVLVYAIFEIATYVEPPQTDYEEYIDDYYDQMYEEETIESEAPSDILLESDPISDFAEVEPEFPGGEEAMTEFIQDNVYYPELSKEMGEQGTVYVQFVVNTDGTIQD